MYRGLPGPGVYCLIDEVDIIRPRGQYYDCSLFVPRRIMNAVQICWSLSLAWLLLSPCVCGLLFMYVPTFINGLTLCTVRSVPMFYSVTLLNWDARCYILFICVLHLRAFLAASSVHLRAFSAASSGHRQYACRASELWLMGVVSGEQATSWQSACVSVRVCSKLLYGFSWACFGAATGAPLLRGPFSLQLLTDPFRRLQLFAVCVHWVPVVSFTARVSSSLLAWGTVGCGPDENIFCAKFPRGG